MIEILKIKEENASNSTAIAKFSDAEIQDFRRFYLNHELCRGLLNQVIAFKRQVSH